MEGLEGLAEPSELLSDVTETELKPVAAVPGVPERPLEDLHPVTPLVPLLDAQEDGVDVDHRRASGREGNQPFGLGEGGDSGVGQGAALNPEGGPRLTEGRR